MKWERIRTYEPHCNMLRDRILLPEDIQADDYLSLGWIVMDGKNILKFLHRVVNVYNGRVRYSSMLHTFTLRGSKLKAGQYIYHNAEPIVQYSTKNKDVIQFARGQWDLCKNPLNHEYHHLFKHDPKYVSDNVWITHWNDVYLRNLFGNWTLILDEDKDFESVGKSVIEEYKAYVNISSVS